MRKTLYRKFIVCYIIFGLICFCFTALFSSRLSHSASIRSKAAEIYREVTDLAEDYSSIYSEVSISEDFREKLDSLADYTDQRIWLLDVSGIISYDSDTQNSMEGTMVAGFDAGDSSRYYRTGTFYDSFSSDMLSVMAPVTANYQPYGYVVAHIPLAKCFQISEQMQLPIYVTILALYLFSLLIFLVVHVYIIQPVAAITEGTQEFAAGNLKHTIEVDSEDEFGYLADTLNLMASELSTAEDYQKKFIANVSHDFRSPLTSIKGYLEAMIDGVIPPENQEKYLRIVINETERLNNLTQSMLSLNSLERKNMHLEFSDFDLCPLIKNICATFEGKCSSRNMVIELYFSSASLMVHADMGKIQQVIYNLVDNAIKFSNNDSSIEIHAVEKKDRVFITVRDHGIGIPKENLKQIWNRFFKTDESRGKDKRGTGLGLSIVREIIQAHGETIDVISTVGAGTEFNFRLPCASSESGRNSHQLFG